MIEVLFGIFIGTVSGLTPGIHSNTLSAMIIVYSGYLMNFFTPVQIPVIIFSAAITHTFLDIIPSVFTGVPDEDTAIAVLPAHDMVLDGRGVEAITISALSSLLSFLLSIPFFFIFLILLNQLNSFLEHITVYFLILTSIYIIMQEKEPFDTHASLRKKFYALLVFLFSGVLGLAALKFSYLAELNPASSVLLPLFSGLFASPSLITSIVEKSKIPEQKVNSKLPSIKEVTTGSLSGSLVSVFPGVSSGVATAIASAHLKKSEQYISSISAANTSNAMLCFAVFLATGKIRSGAVDAASRFYFIEPNAIIVAGILTSLIAALLTLLFGITMSRVLPKLNFPLFSSLVLIFLTLFIYFLTGWFGLTVYAVATPIGLSTLFLGVRRINCMGCLIVPVILFQAGF